ncbi:hypothetical protein Cantr_01962 [Candida viswanathii]|uniref:Uncharacterized protein n=1 Tax=Candida viswanathii TaxID=5486 RepID=A0A367YKV4_9ASCO|nr:hypothetical protein Cantr_01962 [Candida viswanathii]
MLSQVFSKSFSSVAVSTAARRLSTAPVNNNHTYKVLASVVFYSLATVGVASLAERNNKGYLFKQLGYW